MSSNYLDSGSEKTFHSESRPRQVGKPLEDLSLIFGSPPSSSASAPSSKKGHSSTHVSTLGEVNASSINVTPETFGGHRRKNLMGKIMKSDRHIQDAVIKMADDSDDDNEASLSEGSKSEPTHTGDNDDGDSGNDDDGSDSEGGDESAGDMQASQGSKFGSSHEFRMSILAPKIPNLATSKTKKSKSKKALQKNVDQPEVGTSINKKSVQKRKTEKSPTESSLAAMDENFMVKRRKVEPAEGSVKELLLGEKTHDFEMGFHMVKGRGQAANKKTTIAEALTHESSFFYN